MLNRFYWFEKKKLKITNEWCTQIMLMKRFRDYLFRRKPNKAIKKTRTEKMTVMRKSRTKLIKEVQRMHV